MRTWLSTLSLFLCILGAEAHPLHLSVTNINIENGKLKVSMKTFRDDWELAYFHENGHRIDFRKEESRKEAWFMDYLTRSFIIKKGKGEEVLPLNLISVSLEEDAMQIDLQAELGEEPNSLYIYQALLTDIYPDQNNLVILSFGKRETGIKFDVRKLDELVSLN